MSEVAGPIGCADSVHPDVALVHDQLVQRGGAERVVLLMADAFPGSPIYTSLFDPTRTFPEFALLDVRCSRLDRVAWFRSHVRAALPFMAHAFSSLRPTAAVTLCSSTGWSHGIRAPGRKIVYCHAPARWLYQSSRYLGRSTKRHQMGPFVARAGLGLLGRPLRRWDQKAAKTAHRYLANSTATASAVKAVYGIEAEVLPPPPALVPGGEERTVAGVEPGYWLCVSRLLPYKNVDVVIEAVRRRPGERLVVVGDGPEWDNLQQQPERRVQFLGAVGDEELRWLYRNCRGLLERVVRGFRPDTSRSRVIRPTGGGLALGRVPRHASRRRDRRLLRGAGAGRHWGRHEPSDRIGSSGGRTGGPCGALRS